MKKFNESLIPDNFKHLIPFAIRWGISCDVQRGEYVDTQPIEDVCKFVDEYEPYKEEINKWLDTFDIEDDWPDEVYKILLLNKAYSEAYFIAENNRG